MTEDEALWKKRFTVRPLRLAAGSLPGMRVITDLLRPAAATIADPVVVGSPMR